MAERRVCALCWHHTTSSRCERCSEPTSGHGEPVGDLHVRWIVDANTHRAQPFEWQIVSRGIAELDPAFTAAQLRKIADTLEAHGWGFTRADPTRPPSSRPSQVSANGTSVPRRALELVGNATDLAFESIGGLACEHLEIVHKPDGPSCKHCGIPLNPWALPRPRRT